MLMCTAQKFLFIQHFVFFYPPHAAPYCSRHSNRRRRISNQLRNYGEVGDSRAAGMQRGNVSNADVKARGLFTQRAGHAVCVCVCVSMSLQVLLQCIPPMAGPASSASTSLFLFFLFLNGCQPPTQCSLYASAGCARCRRALSEKNTHLYGTKKPGAHRSAFEPVEQLSVCTRVCVRVSECVGGSLES